MTALARLEQATRMLAEVRTARDALDVANFAEAARVWARQMGLGLEAINEATGVKVKAERRLAACIDAGQANGEIATRADNQLIGNPNKQNLSDLGVSATRVHESRLLAERFPTDDAVDVWVQDSNRAGDLLSRDAALQEARINRRRRDAQERSQVDPGPLPGGEFNLILADPPWHLDGGLTERPRSRDIRNHYPTMTLDELAGLRIPSADDAVLLMWATPTYLPEQLQILAGWGFTFRLEFVWVKNKIGLGIWGRHQHESLLLAVKGAPGAPLPENRASTVIEAPRGQHSSKPDAVYELIDRMFPHLTARLELFARRPRAGWIVWGNDEAVVA